MLEDYFSKPTTLDRIRQSWIAPLIEKHLAWMETQGHSKQTIHRRIPLLVQFGEFAKDRGATAVPQLKEHASDFVTYFEERSRCCRPANRQKVFKREVHGCISQFLCFDDPGYDGRTKSRRTVPPSFPFLEAFYAFLREERGLSKASFRVYDYSLRLLQSYLDQIGVVDIKELSPPILSSFVIDAVYFKHDDIKHLLNAAGSLRDTSNAQRRAETWRLMILLGYGLGMRIGEICNLQVGDIDFERNVLLIANSKFGKSRYLPMGPKVAQELGAYVASSKVKDPTQRVFRWREDRNAIHSCNT